MKMKMRAVAFKKMMTSTSVVMFIIIIAVTSCGKKDNDPKPGPPVQASVGHARVWLTMGDQSSLLAQQNDIAITALKDNASIKLDTTSLLQEIDGFGAALTGSSAYLINKKMSASQRSSLLKNLFHPTDGIGISYLRMSIGASDFSTSNYSYDDIPAGETDYPLDNFTIAKDKEDVVPVFKQIIAVTPAIKIMGSPWSPPAWMKTNGNLAGGSLKADAFESYAQYFVKYIKAFAAEGITIEAITPQNEPLYGTAGYPCLNMSADDQRTFIKNNLGPAFRDANIKTKIFTYDHNWDVTSYAISILNDAEAASYIAGSAFHAYGGDVSAMTSVHNTNPSKGLYFTEISGGDWSPDFDSNLQWFTSTIFIGTTKNWSKNVLLWNLALDENNGPQNNGCNNCRGVVTINSGSGTVTKNVEYYAIGHFSKFIKPGAHRISSTIDGSVKVDHIAFMNTDGSKVLVVANGGGDQQTFSVSLGPKQFVYTIPAKAVATIVW